MTTPTHTAMPDQSVIHNALSSNAVAIRDLWNAVIRDTTLTFTSDLKSADDIRLMLREKAAANLPFLVAKNGAGTLTGFATYGPFRGGNGYRHTVEHTVYLVPQAQGAGLGRQMMSALATYARQQDVHSMWAGCSAENPGAVAFHLALGFTQVAYLPQVGRKFDRWLDLILLQKIL